MMLKDWEVWLTYSMYLSGRVASLDDAARSLVVSGLADVASTSEGYSVFLAGSEIKMGHLGVEVAPNNQVARVSIPQGATGFVAEGLVHTAMMRFSETRLFAEESPVLPPYVRAQLGECWLYHGEGPDLIYPSVKLFENGIVLVELRMFSPDDAVPRSRFIDNIVNGYSRPVERIEVGARFAALLPRATLLAEPVSFRDRLRLHRLLPHLESDAGRRARLSNAGDFTFEVVELQPEELRPRSTSEFAHLVAGAVGFSVCQPRSGMDYVLRGQRPVLRVDGPWVGRPHVHLIGFEGQQAGARANEEVLGGDLGWIMARHSGDDPSEGKAHLPASLRPFDDYGVYISEALTLWVQSKLSIERSVRAPGQQRKLSEIIYEQQATAEMVDYGYMVHRRFATRASSMEASTPQLLAAQADLIELEGAMGDVGRFDEVRNLLRRAWETMGVPRLREQATRGLEVRHAEAAILEADRVQRWATALAVVLGIGVVPTVSNDMLQPVWKWLCLPTPTDPSSQTVMFLVGGSAVVCGLLLALRRWARR